MRRDWRVVLPDFVSDALCNEPLPVSGPGMQRHFFADVGDFVHAQAGLIPCDRDVRKVCVHGHNGSGTS